VWRDGPQQFGQLHPMNAFGQLNLTARDGWQPPKQIRNISDLHNAARAWLRQHAGTYRIQRFVPAAASR